MTDHAPLRRDALVSWHLQGARSADRFAIGVEYERLCIDADGKALPYEGEVGIRAILQALARDFGWRPGYEGECLVSLSRGGASITLEPAGQLELSGAPLLTTAAMRSERDRHLAELRAVCEPLGVRSCWLGMNPVDTPRTAPRIPKARYDLMRAWMPTVGARGLDMMHLTCTVQVNLDFGDECDAMRRLRLGYLLTPVLIALFANSPWRYGRPAGMASARADVWTDVDSARCDPGAFVWDPAATLGDYVDWALGVPMYFVAERDPQGRTVGQRLVPRGFTFADFLRGGLDGRWPDLDDWELHTGTLFPDVRLKRFIELRGADCVPPRLLGALPALARGLFYDESATTVALELLRDGDPAIDRAGLRDHACRFGLDGGLPELPLRWLATELLDLARQGLTRLQTAGLEDADSAADLDELEAIARGEAQPLWRRVDARLKRWVAAGRSPNLQAVSEP